MVFSLGTILYVALLLTNAIAILSEERFLAKSTSSSRIRTRAGPNSILPPSLYYSRLVNVLGTTDRLVLERRVRIGPFVQ